MPEARQEIANKVLGAQMGTQQPSRGTAGRLDIGKSDHRQGLTIRRRRRRTNPN
jgi:hypothetical protein